MSKNILVALLVLIPLACRTSMEKRKDASPGAEAGMANNRPDSLIPIEVTQLPPADAGAPDAPASNEPPDSRPAGDAPGDSPTVDTVRDRGFETASASVSDVAGRTFGLSANDAIPDAGLYGRSCVTSNPGANYGITFSSDGAKVTIRRTDPVQEVVLTGTLQPGSSSTLTYNLDNTFAGGALRIQREGGDLIGELVLYGSGVPVLWCITSPMRPA